LKRLICKSLAPKCADDKKTADTCCYIRLIWMGLELVAIVAIVANAAHQW